MHIDLSLVLSDLEVGYTIHKLLINWWTIWSQISCKYDTTCEYLSRGCFLLIFFIRPVQMFYRDLFHTKMNTIYVVTSETIGMKKNDERFIHTHLLFLHWLGEIES